MHGIGTSGPGVSGESAQYGGQFKGAKAQLRLITREWYMNPNGQLPAYEWDFGDVNPPVHALAALAVFEIDGRRDRDWLERMFHKLLLGFTWWANVKDPGGDHLFGGGFLGMDNVGPFDRSAPLPTGDDRALPAIALGSLPRPDRPPRRSHPAAARGARVAHQG